MTKFLISKLLKSLTIDLLATPDIGEWNLKHLFIKITLNWLRYITFPLTVSYIKLRENNSSMISFLCGFCLSVFHGAASPCDVSLGDVIFLMWFPYIAIFCLLVPLPTCHFYYVIVPSHVRASPRSYDASGITFDYFCGPSIVRSSCNVSRPLPFQWLDSVNDISYLRLFSYPAY